MTNHFPRLMPDTNHILKSIVNSKQDKYKNKKKNKNTKKTTPGNIPFKLQKITGRKYPERSQNKNHLIMEEKRGELQLTFFSEAMQKQEESEVLKV